LGAQGGVTDRTSSTSPGAGTMATGAKTAEASIKATTPNGQKKYEHWLKSKDRGENG
jgi:hypothetical protein